MNYTFKSKTPRFGLSEHRSLPAPGYYKIENMEDEKPSAMSSFKSSGRRKDYAYVLNNKKCLK